MNILSFFKRKNNNVKCVDIPLSLTFKSLWNPDATKQLTFIKETNTLNSSRSELSTIDQDKIIALEDAKDAYEKECKEAKMKFERHLIEIATQYDTRKRELEGIVAKLSIN